MEKVNIRIFDSDINFLGEIDDYTSLVFTRKWADCHEFEFHINKWNEELYKKGNVILLGKDTDKAGVIKYIEDNENGSEKEVIIKGYGLSVWLKDRVTYPPSGQAYDTYNTYIEDIIIGLITNNVVNPSDTNRIIPHFTYNVSANRGGTTSFQTRFEVLFDEIVKLCNISALGFNVAINSNHNTYVLKVLEGADRSVNQTNNSHVIFSKNFDNIKSLNYVESDIDYKNCAIVGGQGTGTSREISYVGANTSGFSRKEVFVDARDVSTTAGLTDRGREKLAEYQETLTFDNEVEASGYGTQWDLGDFVTVKDEELGVTERSQILEVKEIYEREIKVEVTLGNSTINFRNKVKQIATEVSSKDTIQGNHILTDTGIKLQKLWSGSCATGDTITVPDIGKFRIFAVRFESADGTTSVANYVLCARYGTTYLRGSGGFPTNSAMVFYGINFIIDGTQLTATAIAYQAMGGTYTPRTINVIYGIL